MKLKILTLLSVGLLFYLLLFQMPLIGFSVPRFAWIKEGFILTSIVTIILATVISIPFKRVTEAVLASLSIILFCTFIFLAKLIYLKFPELLFVASLLATIGLFLAEKFRKAFSVFLGLCVFSWLFLTLVYTPIAIFYFEYYKGFPKGAYGALISVKSAFLLELKVAALILPSLVLYLITRNVDFYKNKNNDEKR